MLARDIEATAERASSLVKSVLGFARPRPWRVQPVTLSSVVSALRPLIELITGPEIKLVLALDERPLQVNVDRSQLEQAILNLISNARNAMPHGGELTITTTQASLGQHHGNEGLLSPHVVLIIHDTGVGMPDDVQRRAFDPFFTTRAASGGTGLGLTSVQQFVRENQGLIMLDSEAGRGTTVVVHLPRAEKESPAGVSARH
jgi:signal transduction histidine kinase